MAGYDRIESMHDTRNVWASNGAEPSAPKLILENNINLQKDQSHRNSYRTPRRPLDSARPLRREPHHWDVVEQRQWTSILFIGALLAYATRTIMPLVAVSVAEEFGWDKTDMGFVLGCFFWGYPIFQILGGHFSDKIGGAEVMYRGAFMWSAVCVFTPYTAYMYSSTPKFSVLIMALLRFFMGLFQGVHFPSLTSLVSSRVIPADKALVLAITFSAASAGSVFTGAIGSLMLSQFHWSWLFYSFGTMGLVWAFSVRVLLQNSNKYTNGKSKPNHINGDILKTDNSKTMPGFPARQLFTKSPFWAIFIVWVCAGFVHLLLLNWLPTYFTEVFPGHKGWVFNVVPWLIQIPMQILSGYFSGKLVDWGYETGHARKIIYTISAGSMISSLLLVNFTTDYNVGLLLMVIALGGHAIGSSGGTSVNIQDIAPNQAGAVYGLVNTAGACTGFVGSYLTGYILHVTDSWTLVFCMSSGLLAVGWSTFIYWGSGKPIL